MGGGGGSGGLNSTGSQTPRQGTDPVGKVKAPPSLSSWQMKEPKQSSPALSNAPGTPLPDPPTAEADRDERRTGLGSQSRALKPTTQLHPEGASQGRPAPGPLPHSLWLQLCGGPRQRKTKTWAEETAAGAPPENPGQKARGPPTPAAWPPRAWHHHQLCGPGLGSPGPVGAPARRLPPSPCLAQLFFQRDTKLTQQCPPTGAQ